MYFNLYKKKNKIKFADNKTKAQLIVDKFVENPTDFNINELMFIIGFYDMIDILNSKSITQLRNNTTIVDIYYYTFLGAICNLIKQKENLKY